MAGHSQFKNIMHRKGAQDARKAKIFNKIAREITVSCKTGAPDPNTNPRLRAAISAAREANMPRERIDRAIKVATGAGDTAVYEEIRYEGYGPGGVAIIVESLTDNRNRTAAEVRMIFSKNGGSLGESNSVAFMFTRAGYLFYPAATTSEDAMLAAVIENGGDNVESTNEGHEVLTTIEEFAAVRDSLERLFGTATEARLIWKPQTRIPASGETLEQLMNLIEALEDNDDVQVVTTNIELTEEQ